MEINGQQESFAPPFPSKITLKACRYRKTNNYVAHSGLLHMQILQPNHRLSQNWSCEWSPPFQMDMTWDTKIPLLLYGCFRELTSTKVFMHIYLIVGISVSTDPLEVKGPYQGSSCLHGSKQHLKDLAFRLTLNSESSFFYTLFSTLCKL